MFRRIVSRLKKILLRRRPIFRFSWRFVLPCNGYISIHRKVMLRSIRFQPWLLCVFVWQFCTWCLCWHWLSMYRAFHQYHDQAINNGVSISQQILGLLRSGLGQGISAFDFYQLKLYQVAPHLWWEYVFDSQLPYFHNAFQPIPISQDSRIYLSNKNIFAVRLSASGGHSVPTLDSINLNEVWPVVSWLNLSEQVFIKPDGASRSEGCVTLSKHQGWQFEFLNEYYEGEQGLSLLKPLLPLGRYLVQPLLENHPEMNTWQCNDKTITLRIVSYMYDGVCNLAIGNLELNDDMHRRFRVFAIDLLDGGVSLEAKHCASLGWAEKDRRVMLPYWHELQTEIKLAHSVCTDVHTVGWDAVITATGVVLLEGNFNWGINPLQRVRQAPLLPLLCQCSSGFLDSLQ